jgi:mannose-6-phosphate isomerase-like protein (cupin superfamily)/quercetin dioxygenase-like cupin family protein
MRAQLTKTSAAEGGISADISQLGFFSSVSFLTPAECAKLVQHFARSDLPAPLSWFKGRAATDPIVYQVATRAEVLALLRPLLGPDVVLWGAVVVRRQMGTRHSWHTDMESADPRSRVISAWIGLRNTSDASGLRFVVGSHRFNRSVQEVLAASKIDRESLTDERMLEIAQTIDPGARIAWAGSQDGEMVLFDGRIWHSGHNDGTTGTRTALLLQYAAAETPIPMPANQSYEWPWTFADSPRVPTILVSGTARYSANRIVPAPMPPLEEMPMITTVAKSVALPLAENPVKRWQAYPQFRGQTAALATMSCHISVLSAGHRPHPPHIHHEEELLVLLDGEVDIELADDPDGTGSSRHQMRPGMFSYYPATQHHTVHNTGSRPATYLMLKWHGAVADSETPLPARIFEYQAAVVPAQPKPIVQKLLFQQATHSLNKLHAHLTTLQPGAGYEPHADPYDVAILLFSGEVETVGQRVGPLGLIYYSAGELHGMRNVGSTPATYLVFEFHSPLAPGSAGQAAKERIKRGLRRLFRRIVNTVSKLGR